MFITCRYRSGGVERGEFTWYGPSVSPEEDNRVTITTTSLSSELTIFGLRQKDNGTYHCTYASEHTHTTIIVYGEQTADRIWWYLRFSFLSFRSCSHTIVWFSLSLSEPKLRECVQTAEPDIALHISHCLPGAPRLSRGFHCVVQGWQFDQQSPVQRDTRGPGDHNCAATRCWELQL